MKTIEDFKKFFKLMINGAIYIAKKVMLSCIKLFLFIVSNTFLFE